MSESKVWYEPHPVSAERKAELREQGYTIVDAIYAPKAVAGRATPGPTDGSGGSDDAESSDAAGSEEDTATSDSTATGRRGRRRNAG